MAVGAGLFTNFGLKTSWPEGWAGRCLATFSSLEPVTVNLTVARRPLRWLSFGVGVLLTWARAKLSRHEDLAQGEARVRFSGNDFAVSGSLGVLFSCQRPGARDPRLPVGAHWRARYDADRLLVSAGGSVGLPRDLRIDSGVMGVLFRSRDSALTEFPVRFTSWAVLVSLGAASQP